MHHVLISRNIIWRSPWGVSAALRLVVRHSNTDAASSSAVNGHVPVLLGEVLNAFADVNLKVSLLGILNACKRPAR